MHMHIGRHAAVTHNRRSQTHVASPSKVASSPTHPSAIHRLLNNTSLVQRLVQRCPPEVCRELSQTDRRMSAAVYAHSRYRWPDAVQIHVECTYTVTEQRQKEAPEVVVLHDGRRLKAGRSLVDGIAYLEALRDARQPVYSVLVVEILWARLSSTWLGGQLFWEVSVADTLRLSLVLQNCDGVQRGRCCLAPLKNWVSSKLMCHHNPLGKVLHDICPLVEQFEIDAVKTSLNTRNQQIFDVFMPTVAYLRKCVNLHKLVLRISTEQTTDFAYLLQLRNSIKKIVLGELIVWLEGGCCTWPCSTSYYDLSLWANTVKSRQRCVLGYKCKKWC